MALSKEVLRREALIVGLEVGIYFLLRKSEYLPHRGVSGQRVRGIKWGDFRFLDAMGNFISFERLGVDVVDTVSLVIQASKTDQLREGRIRTHKRQLKGHCIVAVVVQWAVELRRWGADPTTYVFEWRGEALITDVSIASTMKAIVSSRGLDNRLISAHSLRYGGATMLAAAGVPSYIITYFGGWSEGSEMIRRYAQVGGEAIDNVSAIMSRVYGQDDSEIRKRQNTFTLH
jgi:hypothetical protein